MAEGRADVVLVGRTGTPDGFSRTARCRLMHDTAYQIGKLFLESYVPATGARVLEVGAFDVNGSLRRLVDDGVHYVGVDIEAGPSVDVVSTAGGRLPFADGSFDVVMASSVFEHDTAFWITFREMSRVLRPGGWLYVSSPSNGWVHRYPLDCWRFYPDAGRALALASHKDDVPVDLIESFIADRDKDVWNDFVAVFRRTGPPSRASMPDRLHRRVACRNVYDVDWGDIRGVTAEAQDMQLLAAANAALDAVHGRPGGLNEVQSLLELASSRLASLTSDHPKPASSRSELLAQAGQLLAASAAVDARLKSYCHYLRATESAFEAEAFDYEVALDSEIPLTSGGSIGHCVSGWAEAHDWGVWSDGGEAVCRLDVRAGVGGGCRLAFLCRGAVHERSPRRVVDVFVNDIRLERWTFVLDDPLVAWRSVDVPPDHVADGRLLVRFVIAEPVSPKDWGMDYGRKIGIGLSKVKASILPVDAAGDPAG